MKTVGNNTVPQSYLKRITKKSNVYFKRCLPKKFPCVKGYFNHQSKNKQTNKQNLISNLKHTHTHTHNKINIRMSFVLYEYFAPKNSHRHQAVYIPPEPRPSSGESPHLCIRFSNPRPQPVPSSPHILVCETT